MDYTGFLEEQLRAAAVIALGYFGKVTGAVKPDDNNQVLTEADVAVGKHLVAAVQQRFPDHNIIDEEAGVVDKGSEYTWVIDPIEATSNFAAGMNEYGIMVGLLKGDTPFAGGIIVPAYDRLYLAQKGQGATCNGRAIHVTSEANLSNVLMSFGIDSNQGNPDQTIRECRMLADLILAVRNMRNSGCEAVDPMFVAEGKLGARINMAGKIWDNVAPQIIAEEAGAIWTDAYGDRLDYSNPTKQVDRNFTFCVASPALHKRLVAITARYREAA